MKTLDICIPAYNEAPVIVETVRRVLKSAEAVPDLAVRVIVSVNGSTDNTEGEVAKLALKNVTTIVSPHAGKGGAVTRAAQSSNTDYFAYIDADLSVDPKEIFSFIVHVDSGADVVAASRLKNPSLVDRSDLRTLSSRLYNGLIWLVLGLITQDAQCGLKVMNRRGLEVLQSCKEVTWFQDTEFVWLAERAHLRVDEVPVHWVEFRYADRKSKFSTIAGAIKMLPALFRIVWRHR